MAAFLCHLLLGFLFSAPAVAAPETVLHVSFNDDPVSFDWNLARSNESDYLMNVMEGLVTLDGSMRVQPSQAESWTMSPDGLVYTFTLRRGALWSDGVPLKAKDFLTSWKRLLSPMTGAAYAYLFYGVAGARAFHQKESSDFSTVGLKALDDSRLEVRLAAPCPFFLQLLAFWPFFPIREDLLKKHGAGFAAPGRAVVVGPYVPVEYLENDHILLARNPHYYGARPAFDKVHIRFVGDNATAVKLFAEKKLDLVSSVGPNDLGDLLHSPARHDADNFRSCFIGFNTTHYPFSIPDTRRAFTMALDNEGLMRALRNPRAPNSNFVPKELLPEIAARPVSYDPVKARALLTQSTVKPELIGEIELGLPASDENARIGTFLREAFLRNLGLKIKPVLEPFPTFRRSLDLGAWSLSYRCWWPDYPDADSFFSLFRSESGTNLTGWKSAEYDALVAEAAHTLDRAKRVDLYRRALTLLLDKDVTILPLFIDHTTYLLNPKLTGLVVNQIGYAYLRGLRPL